MDGGFTDWSQLEAMRRMVYESPTSLLADAQLAPTPVDPTAPSATSSSAAAPPAISTPHPVTPLGALSKDQNGVFVAGLVERWSPPELVPTFGGLVPRTQFRLCDSTHRSMAVVLWRASAAVAAGLGVGDVVVLGPLIVREFRGVLETQSARDSSVTRLYGIWRAGERELGRETEAGWGALVVQMRAWAARAHADLVRGVGRSVGRGDVRVIGGRVVGPLSLPPNWPPDLIAGPVVFAVGRGWVHSVPSAAWSLSSSSNAALVRQAVKAVRSAAIVSPSMLSRDYGKPQFLLARVRSVRELRPPSSSSSSSSFSSSSLSAWVLEVTLRDAPSALVSVRLPPSMCQAGALQVLREFAVARPLRLPEGPAAMPPLLLFGQWELRPDASLQTPVLLAAPGAQGGAWIAGPVDEDAASPAPRDAVPAVLPAAALAHAFVWEPPTREVVSSDARPVPAPSVLADPPNSTSAHPPHPPHPSVAFSSSSSSSSTSASQLARSAVLGTPKTTPKTYAGPLSSFGGVGGDHEWSVDRGGTAYAEGGGDPEALGRAGLDFQHHGFLRHPACDGLPLEAEGEAEAVEVRESGSTMVVEGTYEDEDEAVLAHTTTSPDDAAATSALPAYSAAAPRVASHHDVAAIVARTLWALQPQWMLPLYRPSPYHRVAVAFVTALDPTCAVAHLLLLGTAAATQTTPSLSSPPPAPALPSATVAVAVGPRLLPLVVRVQVPLKNAESAAALLLADPVLHVRDDCNPLVVHIALLPIPLLLDAVRLVPGLVPTHLLR